MPVETWNPETVITRGNLLLQLVPAVADLDAPTAAELSTGLEFTCAVTAFNATSSTDSSTVDWLCSTEGEDVPGSTSHSMDDILIKGTGQNDQELIDALEVGNYIYVIRRDGLPKGTALAAGQKVWVWRVVVTSIDPADATNQFYGVTAHVTVSGRSNGPVSVV